MSRKTIVMMGMIIGSFTGAYAAIFLGAQAISYASLLTSAAGGILGIWITY
jgi:hypothetical protein